jgi:hypothetical protein
MQLKHKTIHISEIGVSFFSWNITTLEWVEILHTYTLIKAEQTYKGCLVNKLIVCTMQHDYQVIWHMPHGCWDRHLSFMSPSIPHLLKSCGFRWSHDVIASCTFVPIANLFVPFSLVQRHDSHRGTSVVCRRDVEECSTESVATSHECGLALSWRRMTPHDNMLGLLVFIVLLSCSRVSA